MKTVEDLLMQMEEHSSYTVISAQGTAGHFYRLRRTIKM